MKDLTPLFIFFSFFFTSLILRVLASKNLLEEYSTKRSNVIFNSRDSWSLNGSIEKGNGIIRPVIVPEFCG